MSGKGHRVKKAGRKVEKRKTAEQKKKGVLEDAQARKQNPRAFAFQSANVAKGQKARTAEREQRRLHAPMLERVGEEAPPLVVLVQGPPQVLKQLAAGQLCKKRRITFIECPQDLHGMLDAAKYADLVLLLDRVWRGQGQGQLHHFSAALLPLTASLHATWLQIDGSFGFEMETFEFLNLLQVHGFPKVMGVLTHLDNFQDQKALKRTKKKLKARFWTEIYDGAKLFYLSGIQHGKYLKREVLNLARFISVMKTRPLTWRLAHPYVIADRMEDITPRERVRVQPKCDREVVLYGYLRGANLKAGARVHLAGVGDFNLQELDMLPDPCALPDSQRKKGLNDKERLLYAPMSDVGGMLYDKDAVYIDIPDWKVQYSHAGGAAANGPGLGEAATEGEAMVRGLQAASVAVDEAMAASHIRLFQGGKAISASDAALMARSKSAKASTEESEGGESSDSGDSLASEDLDADDDGSEWSEDNCDEGDLSPQDKPRGRVQNEAVQPERLRRPAVFGKSSAAGRAEASGQPDDSDDEDGHTAGQQVAGNSSVSEDASDDDESDEGMGGAARWKQGLLDRAGAVFAARAVDLSAYVYGPPGEATQDGGTAVGGGLKHPEDQDTEEGGEEEEDEDFFQPRKPRDEVAAVNDLAADDALDSSRVLLPPTLLSHWEQPEAVQGLRNRFVTGDWAQGQQRSGARPQEDAGEGEEDGEGSDEVFGDVEDMETGARFTPRDTGGDEVLAAAQNAILQSQAEELRQKRAAKKAAFDAQYDAKGAKGVFVDGAANGTSGPGDADGSDGEEGERPADGSSGGRIAKGRGPADQAKEETYYDAVKREMVAKAAATRSALDALDPASRKLLEGLRPGSYVRMRFTGMPCELVMHHDPRTPLLVGGLGQNEDKMGMMKLRFKRHRWFPKILKTRDPLVFSMGWRRFQSLPVYALEDHNRRLRAIKYTPEHMHCMAAVYGPLAPQNTGVVAIQNTSSSVAGWRVSGTGVVLELDADLRVVKKLKLVGRPVKVSHHTAFIQGMFNSQLEAAKFEGAAVRTVSGIRGTIKKAMRAGGNHKLREGDFRASFEDKILMSDLVFLRAWAALELPRFHNPVTNLLAAQDRVARDLKPAKKKALKAAGLPLPQPSTAAALPLSGPSNPSEAQALLAKPLVAQEQGRHALDQGHGSGPLPSFQPAARFSGAQPGRVFKLGMQGLGYYPDSGLSKDGRAAAPTHTTLLPAPGPVHSSAPGSSGGAPPAAGAAGWLGMRTTGELRRAVGQGAPRQPDSLYRDIVRAPRQFNPLKIPKTLQAALPFKTKPKVMVARPKNGRKTLDQKRAVVLEPGERKAVTLLQQLQTIRNEKAAKRREQQARKSGERAKKQEIEASWRGKLNKERRKDRYREQGKEQKRRDMEAEGGGRAAKKARRNSRASG
ncbi:hypothetical protein QJQ45_009839 [Haematococcus lacustris]|nr:hypothetical protein QJQ45_009839 [Haematococcus lacustris]